LDRIVVIGLARFFPDTMGFRLEAASDILFLCALWKEGTGEG